MLRSLIVCIYSKRSCLEEFTLLKYKRQGTEGNMLTGVPQGGEKGRSGNCLLTSRPAVCTLNDEFPGKKFKEFFCFLFFVFNRD